MNEDWKKDSRKIVERWANGADPWHSVEPPTPAQCWGFGSVLFVLGVFAGMLLGKL